METLRLYPPVFNTRRRAVRDTNIGGTPIPAGTEILVPIWWINRHPDFWDANPEDFKPERWIDLSGKPNNHGGAQHHVGFLTFLTGPRSCIGQGFAKAELRPLLAAWMLNFEFELADSNHKIEPYGAITVKPRGGLYLTIKPLQV